MRGAKLWAVVAALALMAGSASAQMGPPRPGPRCLPGVYDGGQMELAARLALTPDHRFRYMLSYGALDESAEGRWEHEGGRVLLTSDPVVPPAFTLLAQDKAVPGQISLKLDTPGGISPQYFSALVHFSDGRSEVRQLSDEGLTMALDGQHPLFLTLLLPILDVESPAFALSPEGGALQLRFEPNDLGKVAFEATPLATDKEDLLLERHDRLIRFRRDGGCEVDNINQ